MMRSVIGLCVFLAGCLGTGFVGSIVTSRSISDWYPSLAKPEINPPDWVFAPVWTTLFVMMAVAGWLVWKSGEPRAVRIPLAIFFGQLGLNFLWSVAFFGLRNPGLALAEIAVLWMAIVATIWTFRHHQPLAALLLVPYLLWVSFAGYLNYMIWRMNS